MSWPTRSTALFLVALWLMPITGCIKLERDYPRRESFLIDVSRENSSTSPAGEHILRIRKIRISPRFQNQSFVYQKGSNSYEADYYNQFFIPPGEMLTEEIRDWLKNSGIFAQVVDRPGQIYPDYFLEGNVSALFGDYSQDPPRAVIGMEFTMIHDLPAGAETVIKKNYRQEISLPARSPEALVEGWEEGLRKILAELESDLQEAIIGRTD